MKITILVVCIMLTIIGVTYSFIAPLISGVETESTISFNSGMIKITYNGSNVITGENIIPGWSETKEFTVVGSNNTSITDEDIMDYQIKLVVEENTFSDGAIRFELTGSSSNELDTLSPLFGKVPTGTGEVLLGTARFNQDDSIKNDVTHSYSLLIGFPNDENKSQNEDMNKSFKGYVVVEEGELQDNTMLASEYIEKVYNDSFYGMNILRYDGTEDNNLRYYGGSETDVDAVPNYISFNNELWRIIGVFETVNADTGEKEKSLKIIRSNALGTTSTIDNLNSSTYIGYSWDTSDSSINNGHGINEWSQADLMNELNGDYLNTGLTTNPTWYNGSGNTQNAEFDKSQVIKEEYQKYIMNAVWYLGGWYTSIVSAANMYKYERGIGSTGTIGEAYNVYQNASDGVTRTTEWTGKVALMYPSDYGFASNDSTYLNNLYNWYNNNRSNNWLYISKGTGRLNYSEWLLTTWDGGVSEVFYLTSIGYVYDPIDDVCLTSYGRGVRPVLHLSSEILIESGDGTSSNPYTISL